jgi:putative FmdB family regulatory protein
VPLYEYRCTKCGNTFEKIQKFSDPLETQCRQCGSQVEQVISPPAVQFKGAGWYVTDYAKKSGSPSSGSKDVSSSAGASKSETKSETKSDAKSSNTDK